MKNEKNLLSIIELPPKKKFIEGIRRAPKRELSLNDADIALALKNALRYIPSEFHDEIAPEFLDELMTMGRIYGYRFRPEGNLKAKSVDEYIGKTLEGRAFQLMIDNNLDFDIALYPYELVTYGETGQVCSNWMQYQLIKKYLTVMNDDETLAILSGHPLGLFKSSKMSPRVVVTNGLMIGQFDDAENFSRAAALGVANYGQMTAGGWMYIGPQGIVHGTYNTLVNAKRLISSMQNKVQDEVSNYSELHKDEKELKSTLFVSSGLGGMSGAQGKAVEIAGGVGIIAEVDASRIETRHSQGWVSAVTKSPKEAFELAEKHLKNGTECAIAMHGNVVDLLEYAVKNNIKIDLLSDQTSCHAVYDGGYCPKGISFEERTRLLKTDKNKFKKLVDKTLLDHFEAIKTLSKRGTYFFDYGNSFLKSVFDAGSHEVCKNGQNELDGFIFPSYVEDILGPVCFDYGYGPFRWVCLSGLDSDLDKTDKAAMECIDPERRFQDKDNYVWIRDAKKNKLVVGSKARILYQDAFGRMKIALKFNAMVRNKEVGAIMLGRDHHDTGGTDSPFRETSNIKDGSNIMADMATQVFAGNAARGMSLVALHNGGGTGVGRSINGGFGMVLDGSKRVDEILQTSMMWDTMCGVARRNWAQNENAKSTVQEFNEIGSHGFVTMPNEVDEEKLAKWLKK
ncbi:MAG: urocanate hydratase [Firmicutes bacterium]|nr:urocanate hydratase [Bacillota bacterium]